jgi:structural maintenance of chromosome 2
MFIEEVIIDGFKSYANRTVISGFDPYFNAITGLNGSGKSNIVDAICFVLGITNWSQLRASSLQELVYKQGQAGIRKASVTVVFNNKDPKTSPVGYEQYEQITVTRQIIVGGRSKYLINGHNAQLNRVQNLFHSVQLNINNPHFLIMQGHITKVLNMKPPEILAMIEEAAGTRMFELKKTSALKTIEKKQRKVDEIKRILAEEITPTLENLKKERAQYMQWLANKSEYERLSKFRTAYEFSECEAVLRESEDSLKEKEATITKLREEQKTLQAELATILEQLRQLTGEKNKERSDSLHELEMRLNEASKELVKLNTALNHQREALTQEQRTFDELQAQLNETETTLTAKRNEHTTVQREVQELERTRTTLAAKLEALHTQRLQAEAGVAPGHGKGVNLHDQLLAAKRTLATLRTDEQCASLRVEHNKREIADLKQQLQQQSKEATQLEADRAELVAHIEQLKRALAALQYNEAKESDLLKQKKEMEKSIGAIREKVESLSIRLTLFKYTPPTPDFDQSRVKGPVAELIKVKDVHTHALALEVGAGVRLYHVVVDTQHTGQLLLDKGQLTQRVTLIPLSHIVHHTTDKEVLEFAQREWGKEKVTHALSLIEYNDPALKPAIHYVFGTLFVCDDLTTAQQVTFHPKVLTRSVTLEGDLCDPEGTLTGGSVKGQSLERPLLLRIHELHSLQSQLAQHQRQLEELTAQLTALHNAKAEHIKLTQQLELKSHALELLQQRIAQTAHFQLVQKIQTLEAQLQADAQLISEAARKQCDVQRECEELEQQMQHFNQDQELERTDTLIRQTKAQLDQCTKHLKEVQQRVVTLASEIEELQSELQTLYKKRDLLQGQLKELNSELTKLAEQADKKQAECDRLTKQLEKKRQKYYDCDQAIQEFNKQRTKQEKRLADIEIQLKNLDHSIQGFHTKKKNAQKRYQHLLETHPWIQNEKQFFGKPQSDYDFATRDLKQVELKLKALEEEQDRLAKTINKKVLNMLEKAEQEYQDLMEKKRIIENDKAKIETVIKELDQKKNQTLKAVHDKVNKDFGSIFSTLLPGTKAELVPVSGGDVLSGLEVRVAFGNVWKESLSELSGGQRSLLALSLILALLLFKPAPMYILDEIDSALDLSHTQNIGQMLRTHFMHSQFIVVSLKEGMFNNANVVFRTKFVDGVSTVQRIDNRRK